MRRICIALFLWCALSACTERKHPTARRDDVLLTAAPKPAHPLDLSFDDKVDLIGYELDTPRPSPGMPFKVTWFWRVRAPLGDGVQVFTHLADGQGVTQQNLDSQRTMRVAYPEASWRAGNFIRDEQVITLPDDWGSPSAMFYLGFYVGARRFDVTRGPHDAERRGEALRIPVNVGPSVAANAPLPEVKVPRLKGKLTIDGKLNEADWASAPLAAPMVQTRSGAPGEFFASARMLYDDARLYIAFNVADDNLKSPFQNTDDHLWEQDCVEIMFDPDDDAKNYFELQVSPRGVHFDTRYDSRRNPRPFGHVDWDSQVEAKVVADGTLDDAKSDRGYTVELAVPFAAFATGDPPATPPKLGTLWRINFFVMDSRADGQRAVGWSPPRVGDFHVLEKFGRAQFQ